MRRVTPDKEKAKALRGMATQTLERIEDTDKGNILRKLSRTITTSSIILWTLLHAVPA